MLFNKDVIIIIIIIKVSLQWFVHQTVFSRFNPCFYLYLNLWVFAILGILFAQLPLSDVSFT